jgi:hypothetical protein
MADYYSLLKKAIACLDPPVSSESRRGLYERARSAQLAQLRAIIPSLAETEIVREQKALERAVRTVEAEIVQPVCDVAVAAIGDLVKAADEIGKPIARAENLALLAQASALAKPVPPAAAIEVPPPMIVRGHATGRLTRYWRWRSFVSPSGAPGAR